MHKHFAIGDLEWMVMPPILANQFRVFHKTFKFHAADTLTGKREIREIGA